MSPSTTGFVLTANGTSSGAVGQPNLRFSGTTLTVDGTANISGAVNISGATLLSNTLAVRDATTLSNGLNLFGTANISGAVNISGAANISGATVLSSTLNVNGVAIMSNTLQLNNNLLFQNALSNIRIGSNIGLGTTGANNIVIGNNAGVGLTSGTSNAVFGTSAGSNLSVGLCNAIFGAFAGRDLSNGLLNTLVGVNAGLQNVAGLANTFVGATAGSATTAGSNNTFIGFGAGGLGSGNSNVFIGNAAGNSSAFSNISSTLVIANNATSNLIRGDFATRRLGINLPLAAAPAYTLDVNGDTNVSGTLALNGRLIGHYITLSNISGTSLTSTDISLNTIGTYFSITNSLFSNITPPTAGMTAGMFWVLRNNTNSTLSITVTGTPPGISSPLSITPSNAVTLVASNATSYVLF